MSDQSATATDDALAALFTRLRAQVGDVATGQSAQAKETGALAKTIKDTALLKVVKAVQAQQTAQSKAATALASAMTPTEKSVTADLATLTAIVNQVPSS